MTGILNALIAGVSGAVKDAYFNLVSLLLPGNGTNGAQNNTFLDGSSNNFTITRNGNTTQGTFSPFSQTGWSAYFDGSNDYVTATLATALTSTYTIDFWINTNSVAAGDKCILNIHTTSSNTVGFVVKRNGSQIQVNDGATGGTGPSGGTLAVGVWKFVTIVCNATNTLLYIDGSLVNTYNGVTLSGSPTFVHIGSFGDLAPGNYADAYISNLRIIVGSAITPSATPPTSPSQSTGSTTKLLTLQSNRFVDNGTNSLTVTPNNGVAITPFSPFAPTQSYSAAAVGGSGYFDGTGDYLTGPTNTATAFNLTGDFTIEAWIYCTDIAASPTGGQGILSWADSSGWNGWQVFHVNGSLKFEFLTGSTGAGAITSSTITNSQWVHIAVVRSGTSTDNIKFYVNGVSGGSVSYNSSQTSSSSFIKVGSDRTGSNLLRGYISNARVVNGTAVYTGSFTPPTAPLTAITNTSLLLNFTNAGVVDATAKNVLETVGNAQISTTQSKWGGGSISIPKTSTDYLKSNLPVTDLCAFGSGDFVIEFWLRLAAVPGSGQIGIVYDSRPSATNGAYAMLYIDNATLKYYVSSADRITGSALSINTWYYIAVARASGSTRLYIDGTQQGSTYSDSTVYLNGSQRPLIGTSGNSPSSSEAINGFIDDLRVTKGSARGYSGSTITVPTAPFPVQ